jgi:hypothetical protein
MTNIGEGCGQAPDTKPGNYYVTVKRDDGAYGRLFGPFENDHARALELVNLGRRLAEEVDPRAFFYAYGTARFPLDYTKPGVFNDRIKDT